MVHLEMWVVNSFEYMFKFKLFFLRCLCVCRLRDNSKCLIRIKNSSQNLIALQGTRKLKCTKKRSKCVRDTCLLWAQNLLLMSPIFWYVIGHFCIFSRLAFHLGSYKIPRKYYNHVASCSRKRQKNAHNISQGHLFPYDYLCMMCCCAMCVLMTLFLFSILLLLLQAIITNDHIWRVTKQNFVQ